MRCRSCNTEITAGAPCPLCAATRAKPRFVGAVIEHRSEAADQVHGLRAGRNKLGRDAGSSDIVLNDTRASSDHAYLFVGENGVCGLTDVSRNGTVVDGQVVQGAQAPVVHGSVIVVGALRLTVLLAPAPAEPA